MGAEAILALLRAQDLEHEIATMREELETRPILKPNVKDHQTPEADGVFPAIW